ncbi:MAG: FAD:protein FMN transferase [Bacteroidales bacterium]|nr:FAD:protein FMN transferase [Bacteroidales bacterium]
MKITSKNLIFLSVLILATILILYKSRKEVSAYQSVDGLIFGTIYHINYQSEEELKPAIDQLLQDFNHSLSPFDSTSVISKVNRNEDVELDDYFITIFNRSMEISELTDGAFDITVSPFVNAWGFGFQNEVFPDSTTIDSLLAFTGYEKIELNSENEIVKKDPRITLNASAIAKGYAVDIIADFLTSKGIENFMVEIGGEIITKGVNANKENWRIGINKPVEDSLSIKGDLQLILELKDNAVATSGNYRNYYYRDGIRYAHTIDPRTGYPVQHEILSATIVAPDCMTADAIATSCMVMGLDRSKNLLNSLAGVEGCIIYLNENGEIVEFFTDGMRESVLRK